MSKSFKLYRVHTALLEKDGNEISNWDSKTVVAQDAMAAARRVRLAKSAFVESVELVSAIDVP